MNGQRIRNEDWQVEGVDRQTRAANKERRDREDFDRQWWDQVLREGPPDG